MACFLSCPVHLEGMRTRGWKEAVGRRKSASYSFRTGPTPGAYRPISSAWVLLVWAERRRLWTEIWGAPLFFLPGPCDPHSWNSECKHTGASLGLDFGPQSLSTESQGFIAPPTLTVGMEAEREAEGKGKPLKGWSLLGRNVLSNTNVNMIYATSTARLLLFPWLGNTGRGSCLSSIPEGDRDPGWCCSSIWNTNHSLEMVPRQPIKKVLTILPRNIFLDI